MKKGIISQTKKWPFCEAVFIFPSFKMYNLHSARFVNLFLELLFYKAYLTVVLSVSVI